ncbi:lymphokine-activated killer T-cell-originated protein kinase [Drosophila pseudoobscura]|uniref:Lymphokine-activated killer T-cell-originated protein kinase n=1 Tax=Drosophila pseudoobscura pseudoobscura TaxID=46245 RepID=B5DKM5_DROPS|nr:lymphokine-activated killer T-cell-originated protein kinase [Drosophila pseudoobscura]
MESPRGNLRNVHVENIQNLSTPIRIPPSPMLKTLGYGTGVNVYRLDRSPRLGHPRSPWAIKRITQRTLDKKDTSFNDRIIHEANILRKLSHPNIVGFRGEMQTSAGVNSLALEMCNTSLGSILEERFEEELGPLDANHIFKMIMDIAKALDYLHTEAKLLHGDLKSFNVLVKGEFEICKLCDFGVSLPLDEKNEVKISGEYGLRYVGTTLWSAPEVIDQMDTIDSKADIFSFGLVIYETLALVPPHTLMLNDTVDGDEGCDESGVGCLKDDSIVELNSFLEPADDKENDPVLNSLESAYGTRPPLPEAFELSDDYNTIVELFYLCTNDLGEDRPSARTILKCLPNNAPNIDKSSD